jgi:hypothetical protein
MPYTMGNMMRVESNDLLQAAVPTRCMRNELYDRKTYMCKLDMQVIECVTLGQLP